MYTSVTTIGPFCQLPHFSVSDCTLASPTWHYQKKTRFSLHPPHAKIPDLSLASLFLNKSKNGEEPIIQNHKQIPQKIQKMATLTLQNIMAPQFLWTSLVNSQKRKTQKGLKLSSGLLQLGLKLLRLVELMRAWVILWTISFGWCCFEGKEAVLLKILKRVLWELIVLV